MPVKLANPPPPLGSQVMSSPVAVPVATKSSATSQPLTTPEASNTKNDSESALKSNPPNTQSEGCVLVPLQCPSIGDVMAARLAICVLGHMLYLKSQIPLPVPHLMKISATSASNSKGKKKMDNLLSSYDVLSSHLGTTFTALSTALARSKKLQSRKVNSPSRAAVHVAILLGPTVSAASGANTTRARILLEIADFEVKVWGTREDLPRVSGGRDEREDEEAYPSSDDEDEDEAEAGYDDEEVPSSPDTSDVEDSDDEGSYDDEDEEAVESTSEPEYVNAERMLSRTLAQANADACNGMAAEIPPTLTHVLIRAPRRFVHPAWKPQQQSSLCKALDKMITSDLQMPKNMKGKKRTDLRIRIQCQSAEAIGGDEGSEHDAEEDEEGELIWWSWDAGRLEGFSDW